MQEKHTFYYKSNRLQQLRGFYYTQLLGSVSKAAKKMGLQQCSVSVQIKALERDLGTILFKRNGPNMKITEEGKVLYKIIVPYIESIDSLPSQFQKQLKNIHSKKLQIAANHTSIKYIIPPLIGACKDEYPDMDIKIKSANETEAFDLLRKDSIQAYIGPVATIPQEFEYIEIDNYEVILIAHKNHPLITSNKFELLNISSYKTVRTPDANFFTVPFFEETLEQYKVETYAEIENIDWEILKSFVASTNTFTIVSDICYNNIRDHDIGKRSLKAFIPNMSYGIVTKKGREHTKPLLKILETYK